MIHANDIKELQRMVTNFSDNDKVYMSRVLRGIAELQREVGKLKLELAALKKDEK